MKWGIRKNKAIFAGWEGVRAVDWRFTKQIDPPIKRKMSTDKTKSVFQADGDTILRRYAATAAGSPGMHKTKSCWPGGGFAKQTGGGEFAAQSVLQNKPA